ncbi:MAG: sugar-binding transcriptional regulator [Cohaesibacter sp.]|nr:sugar-binding transcriptional regulator [Cohaesibacter sp.]MCV6601169.1 sugar-binding transcriptional regulator [Cohaesibacter sp.]
MSTVPPSPEQMHLIARVLSLHYEEERLQSDVAKELGLSTAKVNRLIKQGRELGMVQITIKSPLVRYFDLERKIAKRWNLKKCLVVPSVSGSEPATLNEVGKGAASLLKDTIRDGDTIAISGGRSLSVMIENMTVTSEYDISVVPMTGGVQGHHYTDVNHIATELAQKLSGHATLIHAPLHAASEEERDLVLSLKSVREVMDEARKATVAVVGIGAVAGASSTYYMAHPVSEAERQRLYQSGVRSEFLGHLIEQDGSSSGISYNSRLVALLPKELAAIPITIAIASGPEKVEPIAAALNGKYFNSLVTDEDTATTLLEQELQDA